MDFCRNIPSLEKNPDPGDKKFPRYREKIPNPGDKNPEIKKSPELGEKSRDSKKNSESGGFSENPDDQKTEYVKVLLWMLWGFLALWRHRFEISAGYPEKINPDAGDFGIFGIFPSGVSNPDPRDFGVFDLAQNKKS